MSANDRMTFCNSSLQGTCAWTTVSNEFAIDATFYTLQSEVDDNLMMGRVAKPSNTLEILIKKSA
ncbi:MAG: hypothetical protein M3Y53_03135 [Thermoproteota archaeon]|nr:hypothetical protein [Thermoproteota archaeon]